MRDALKRFADVLSLVAIAPAGALCGLERRWRPQSEAMFVFWAQALAIVPGALGVVLRRAFYRLTLDDVRGRSFIAFGAMFTHRHVTLEDEVFIGAYALVGCATLRRGCMVGSRASLLSGASLHELDANGRWGPSNLALARGIDIGEHALIGEGAVVMADIGRSAMVAAGAVVSAPVPPLVVVGGNPARFIKHLSPAPHAARERDERSHASPIPAIH